MKILQGKWKGKLTSEVDGSAVLFEVEDEGKGGLKQGEGSKRAAWPRDQE
jgi:hypothetical protein